MRTTLDLPDSLFHRLKARAAAEHTTLKQLLRGYVEQGLSAGSPSSAGRRSAAQLPRHEGPLLLLEDQFSNAALADLLDP
jgi:hypothetical protein